MTLRRPCFWTLCAAVSLLALTSPVAAQVSMTTLGSPSTQNFDTLATSGTTNAWADNSTLTGWYSQFVAVPTNPTTYRADAGGSNTGAIYSWGTGTATERAFGSVASGTPGNILNAVRLVNNTGSTIGSLQISFNGEQWRNGGNTSAQQLDFQYQVAAAGVITDANTPTAGWLDFNSLDFVSPTVGATAAALDGNAAANRTALSATLTVTVNAGQEIWLRWFDTNDTGNDHGLSIDDFSVTPQGLVSLPNLTIDDVSLNEGNAGTTTFTFTVSLSAPAGAGGVTFDIATADNTATQPSDYTQKSLTSQTIPAGSSTYTFDVLVNGDTTPEVNETFFVNVGNVTGANVTDGQGQGTILNDDAAPNLTINDVTLNEGNSGTTTFSFTVSLSAPAGVGGVTFDIATADSSAIAPGDYTAKTLLAQTIPAGSSTYGFDVLVNGDGSVETNETFFVNLTNVVNAIATDGQGLGTIVNDDFTPIHDIQGNGASSPLVGNVVTTRGVVTGRKSNGYFIQEPDASIDADPATSEGVFVFTSSAPPATAAVGNLVEVTGTVVEFVPAADPMQPPMTEIGSSPTTVQLSTGNPMPAAIPLTATFPDPAGVHDQLERIEGMRASVTSLTVVGPTQGNVNEANATATSNGVFYGVVTGVARPFREAGIPAPDPPPSGGGAIPPIPRFDSNPERIRVDGDGIAGMPVIDVGFGATITGLVGPVEYSFRTYTILPELGSTPVAAGGPTPTAVAIPTSQEFTVASFNLERFFDNVNDPAIGEPVLTATAFDNRLNKASLAIRNFLHAPDILGVIEVENLTTLQALASRISSDAIAAAQPDPQYAAFLVEGNDVGGIDVGFLVKTAIVTGATPRVSVTAVVQELDGTLFVNPDASTETLNDRPTLRFTGAVNHANGASFPLTVLVNHLRSLNDVNSEAAGSNGWSTAGARVRAKRQAQAVDLAGLIQARQLAAPTERIVVIGDFNAFEVNDGLVDSMGVIDGTPTPDNETAVPGDGIDLVNPDLVNLFSTPPANERYSYNFDGNAQSIDHILINGQVVSATLAYREEHPRFDSDFPETARNNAAVPTRLSDHDPVVAYFRVDGFSVADLAITKTDTPDPVVAGTDLSYTLVAANAGPDAATTVLVTDTLPAGTTFVSLSAPAGWSCTTPAVGGTGTVSCSIASLGIGSASFGLVVAVDAGLTPGTTISNTAAIGSTTSDPNAANNSGTATTTVGAGSADLSITKTDAPDPVDAGGSLVFTIDVSNEGPSSATATTMTDVLAANLTFVSLSAPAGWSCSTPAVGATGTVTCSHAAFAPGTAAFTLTVLVDAGAVSGSLLQNTATVTSTTADPNPGGESATSFTTVGVGLPAFRLTLVDAPDPVTVGQSLTYGIDVDLDVSVTDAQSPVLTFPLPAGTTFTSLTAPGGWSCTTPAVGAAGTVSCTAALLATGTTSFAVVVQVGTGFPANATIPATASAVVQSNGRPIVATDDETTTVLSPASLSATKTVSGETQPGHFVNYVLVVSNAGPATQPDLAGDEVVDVLPASLTLDSATASSGAVTVDLPGNTVRWNGSIPAGGSVTLTIVARVVGSAGETVSNQATLAWDGDGNGTNEATGVSDDPASAAPGDPTVFVITSILEIPTLDAVGLGLLALLLAAAGAVALRRRTA